MLKQKHARVSRTYSYFNTLKKSLKTQCAMKIRPCQECTSTTLLVIKLRRRQCTYLWCYTCIYQWVVRLHIFQLAFCIVDFWP